MRIRFYIYVSIIATLFAIVAWNITPKEYAATTSISDEYKEMDLGIGMNSFQAQLNKVIKQVNTGINDIEVYRRVLKTEDFARKLSEKKLNKELTYGTHVVNNRAWWQSEEDTVGIIIDRINYNLSQKKAMLTIELKDNDPYVAAMILDSLVNELQIFINNAHHANTSVSLANAQSQLKIAKEEYQAAQSAYSDYTDSHNKAHSKNRTTKEKELRNILKTKEKTYKEVIEKCIREEALLNRDHYSFTVVKANTVPNKQSKSLAGFIIVFLTIALLATFVCHQYKKNVKGGFKLSFGTLSSPWSITILIWGLILTLSLFRDPSLLNPAGKQFYISLILWLSFFISTSLIIYNVLPHTEENNNKATTHIDMTPLNKLVFNCLFWVSVVMTPLYMKKIYDVVLIFGTEDFMSSVREYAVHGDLQLGVLVYSNLINSALLIVSVWAYPHIKKWQLVWAVMGCILNSLAIMEKGGLLLVAFCIMFVLFEKKIIKLRTIAVFGVFVLLLFYMFNIMRAKEDSDYQQNETLFGFIAMYILSPPVAYCELNIDIDTQFGANSLPLLYYYLNKFGFGTYAIMERLQEFVYVPVCTNVYTAFQPYYQDFGQVGVAYFGAINGIICGLLYRYKQNGNDFAKCLYLYFAYVLALQFFQEYIFTSAYFVPRMAIVTYLCTQKSFTLSLYRQTNIHNAQQ